MVLWLKPWCVFMMASIQTLMDVCINVSCTNEVYKHLHHVVNGIKKKLLTKPEKFRKWKKIHDMLWQKYNPWLHELEKKKTKEKMLYDDVGHIIPHHMKLKPHISMS